MKIHSRGMMYLGKRAIQSKPRKQSINTWILTEAEIIGVDDHISGILWGVQFWESKWYKLEDNIIPQYNQRATLTKIGNGTNSHAVFLSPIE